MPTDKKKNLTRARAETFIAKIEGHGSLSVDFKKGKVKLEVHEGERLFEGILVGRTIDEMHWITPRICGVCPIAHNLASLYATEAALGIKVTESTKLLRRVMRTGQNIQSHILHAVFLALPDYIGIDRITELEKTDPKTFADALELKEVGDEIASVVAGRNVHPTRTTVGGFHKVPTKDELKELQRKLKRAIPKAKKMVKLFAGLSYPALKMDLEFLIQDNGKVLSSKREGFRVIDYKSNLIEEVKGYSSAKFGTYLGENCMVGSLARLYFMKNEDALPKKRRAILDAIDFTNPFYNNLAQITEVLLELEEAERITAQLIEDGIDERIAKPAAKPTNKGIGAVEAPRGGLYNEVHINKNNIITYANILTPTVQNLPSMEEAAGEILAQHKGKSKAELTHLIIMLVRAYDPCITCSAH
ncbi:MAG: nickel-dependent hydrogenase large subunit [Proteobacteria bacterium]|nr:nickel-dependent hydrogenase large subunit [Pseudomonadota bacterium]